MNAQVKQVILDCHGYVYITAGLILAFFSSAQQAEVCAHRLQALSKKPHVEVSGSQLILSSHDF